MILLRCLACLLHGHRPGLMSRPIRCKRCRRRLYTKRQP